MKNTKCILVILCLGYFIDFYDLTVFSVSYVDLLKQQFEIFDSTKIQQIYYLINNIQMIGILVGAILFLFGILADKFGRITVIKYSILLYSVMTILCIFVDNIYIFMLLRFLGYLALASEFAVSSVLIVEFFPPKIASWGMSLLYILGVLGGVVATLLGVFSYKVMFILVDLLALVYMLLEEFLRNRHILLSCIHQIDLKMLEVWFFFLETTVSH